MELGGLRARRSAGDRETPTENVNSEKKKNSDKKLF